MTYESFETSEEGSAPIELFRFIQGSLSWEFTSAEDDILVDVFTYEAVSIKRSKLSEGPEDRRRVLTVEVPATNPFALQFINSVPGQKAVLELSRVQRADFPTPEIVQLFTGRVRSVTFSKDATVALISVTPEIAASSRNIPRYTYMGMCNAVLYDDDCQVDDTDPAFRFTGTVSGVSEATISVPGVTGFPDGFFTAGFVIFDGGTDHRMILNHTGDNLVLNLPFPTDVTGALVAVLAGCNHDPTDCHVKFANFLRYQGFWAVPTKNPFIKGLL